MSESDRPSRSPFVIAEQPGFSPLIGRLVTMMSYSRATTLRAVKGLTVVQLDHVHDPQSNSIGALLLHIAAVEAAYQRTTFEQRPLAESELARWGAALDLGDRGRTEIRGNELSYYVSTLEEVRAVTLRELATRDDRWLEHVVARESGRESNNHFLWFHVMEDELNHRGQIRWLRQRLPD